MHLTWLKSLPNIRTISPKPPDSPVDSEKYYLWSTPLAYGSILLEKAWKNLFLNLSDGQSTYSMLPSTHIKLCTVYKPRNLFWYELRKSSVFNPHNSHLIIYGRHAKTMVWLPPSLFLNKTATLCIAKSYIGIDWFTNSKGQTCLKPLTAASLSYSFNVYIFALFQTLSFVASP